MSNTLEIEERIVKMLRTVYDPEIPVNVYDLGLIYKVDVDDENRVSIDNTYSSELSRSRFYRGRCEAEGRERGRCRFGANQFGFRAGVEQRYDERRG